MSPRFVLYSENYKRKGTPMPKLTVAQEVIEQKIYLIRGQRVMLSIHLSKL